MHIKEATFITSIAKDKDFPKDDLYQIAIVGKSNVGKSSLINCLTNQKKLAKTSQQPGATQLINLFLINQEFYLVDLPGYGFAKVPERVKANWQKLLHKYLETSQNLVGIMFLVDIRHEPGDHDKSMAAWVKETGIPYIVAATKADKLSNMQRQKGIERIAKTLDVPADDIIPCSAMTRQGKEELLRRIDMNIFARKRAQ